MDCIQDILWNENAFSRLVLPGAYKEVLFSLVENQIQQDNSFDDIIEGKGELSSLLEVTYPILSTRQVLKRRYFRKGRHSAPGWPSRGGQNADGRIK